MIYRVLDTPQLGAFMISHLLLPKSNVDQYMELVDPGAILSS